MTHLNTFTEHLYASQRVRVYPDSGHRRLYWRGWVFLGHHHRLTLPYASHLIADHLGRQLATVSDWTAAVVTWIWRQGSEHYCTYVGPVEIHSIEDPVAYVAALDAYEAATRLLNK